MAIALIAGLLGVIGTLLGVVSQAAIAERTDRRRAEENRKILLRGEKREVYSQFLAIDPIDEFMSQASADLSKDLRLTEENSGPAATEDEEVKRVTQSATIAWYDKWGPIYQHYMNQLHALVLVSTAEVTSAVEQEMLTIIEFKNSRDHFIAELAGHADNEAQRNIYTLMERFGASRKAVIDGMREDLGYG